MCVENVPQVEVDGADVRDQLLGFEVKLAEVLHLQGPHLWPHQVLQEVVQHGDDPLSQEWVDEDPFDLWRERGGGEEGRAGEREGVETKMDE